MNVNLRYLSTTYNVRIAPPKKKMLALGNEDLPPGTVKAATSWRHVTHYVETVGPTLLYYYYYCYYYYYYYYYSYSYSCSYSYS